MRRIADDGSLDEMLSQETAVLFKHSPVCSASARAYGQVECFIERSPDTPVYLLDVIGERELSNRIAERFGIRHESPQVIVLHRGTPTWNGSHFRIKARAIGREVRRTS